MLFDKLDTANCMGSIRRTCRVETWRAKWNLGLIHKLQVRWKLLCMKYPDLVVMVTTLIDSWFDYDLQSVSNQTVIVISHSSDIIANFQKNLIKLIFRMCWLKDTQCNEHIKYVEFHIHIGKLYVYNNTLRCLRLCLMYRFFGAQDENWCQKDRARCWYVSTYA